MAILVALVVVPIASAAVTVSHIEVPPRTAAGKPFGVSVVLDNDGPARDVHLFGALYTRDDGQAPCGPATGGSFRTFTHIVQETVHLAANAETTHPREGQRWLHRYETEHAGASPSDEEFCVFVAAATGGPVIQYEAYAATLLSVRARNAAPQPSFSVDPVRPEVGRDAMFRATAVDADGDPISFAWDFGRFDASGRAVGEGETASHAFYPEGDHVVTLTASDGIDSVPLARTITVMPASAEEDGRSSIPSASWLVFASAVVAHLLRRRS